MAELNDRERHVAENETLYRRANESLADDYGPDHHDARQYPFMCECGGRSCRAIVRVSLKIYAAVRTHSTQFLIVEGHKQLGNESVVAVGKGVGPSSSYLPTLDNLPR